MKHLAAVCVGVLLLTGCSTKFADIKVDSAAIGEVDLNGYTTYAWGAEAAVLRDPGAEWMPANIDIGAEIRHCIERELNAKGLIHAREDPGLLVVYGVGVDMQAMDIIEEDDKVEFVESPRGEVLVVLFDPKAGEVAWVGAASGEVQGEPDAQVTRARLDHAIKKMFKGYKN